MQTGGGHYKGRGDKSKKYYYNSVFTRYDWKIKNALDTLGDKNPTGHPITPGNDSLITWKDINSLSGGSLIPKNLALHSAVNGKLTWGLTNLKEIQEPINEVEILARVSPKQVNKNPLSLNITEPTLETLDAPNVNPQVNEPLDAPQILLPNVESVEISPLTISVPDAPNAPNAPNINITIAAPNAPVPPVISVQPANPSVPTAPNINISVTTPNINPLSITAPGSVGNINVNLSTVHPVDFALTPAGLSGVADRAYTNRNYDNRWNGKMVDVNAKNAYISTWGKVDNLENFNNITINVKAEDTRAFMVDEGVVDNYPTGSPSGTPITLKPFSFNGGTINLYKSKNVGIDVQGTHTIYGQYAGRNDTYNTVDKVANIQVINSGNIKGHGGTNVENQVGFGFNNFDTSSNNTRTEMINKGKIELNAPKSAGFQLRPETYWSDKRNFESGLVIMAGENTGEITLNSYGSFGFLTVQNKQPGADQKTDYTNYKVKATPGGQIASRAQEANMSYMKNTGTINVNGDDSVGVGLLHNIQGVTVGGKVKVGDINPASFTYSNKTGGDSKKVDGAVGVYSEVRTRPILNNDYDDHALQNTSGKTLGTETVEVSGEVNLGAYAEKSSGLRIKEEGSITLKNGGKVSVGGKNNYGAVVNGKDYDYYRKTAANAYAENGIKYSDMGKINLETGSKIDVTGEASIGYVLLAGKGENEGKITVTGHSNNNTTGSFHGSLGFYGKKGTFTNKGEISSSGNVAHGIALVGDTSNGITFDNNENGKINVEGKGNIGVYADGKYTFKHSGNNAKISVGSNALGIYAKNANGTLNIKAPIELANSTTGGTTIGVYSDGDAKVKFGAGSSLKIGEKAVGLYSSDPTKFNNTFEIETGKTLNVELGKNSTFGLLNGEITNPLSLSKYLNNNTADKINITGFGEGASLFYATLKAKAVLDEDYTITNGQKASTAVLVANDGSSVEIANGKTLKTNTNVGLIATKGVGVSGSTSVAENKGTLISTRTDKGIGIYASTSNGKNSGTITMEHDEAVGILGEAGSNLTNSMKIELKEKSSAGIYGKNSNITQETAAEIKVNKGSSAGMYAIVTSISSLEKTVINKGKIDISGNNEKSSAGIYGNLDSSVTTTNGKLTIDNSGTIDIRQNSAVGIYAKNESNQANTQSIVNNSGAIQTGDSSSIGIVGEKSKISNTGSGINGIDIRFTKSAGILAKKNSEVINSGRISLNSVSASSPSNGLVGISIDNSSTAKNDASGEIIVEADYSTGMLSSGGDITNAGTINLEKKESVGMYATNANVTNSGATPKGILIKDDKSVGIYAKLNSSSTADKKVSNSGFINIGGTSKTGSAGIYSLLEGGATKKLSTENSGTITMDQNSAVGIYAKNESTQDNTHSTVINNGKIEVKKEFSAGILVEKSKVTNSGSGANGIVLSANKTAGIIGKDNSVITNTGLIQTETATPTSAGEGLAGISLSASKATNTSTGEITLDTKYSTGMYGQAASTLVNEGNITGKNKEYIVGMAGDASIATNKKTIILEGKNATGIFGQSNSILLNDTDGTVTLKEESSVGMYSKQNSAVAKNEGTITTEKGTSAAMLGDKGALENNGSITTKEETSAGMYAKNTNATNKKNITTEGKTSAGILVELDKVAGGTVSGTNDTAGIIKVNNETSAAMLGKIKSAVTNSTATLTLTNNHNIDVNSKTSAGMMVVNESTAVGKENVKAENNGTINLTASATNEKNIGILAEKATGINTGTINVSSKESIGMLGQKSADITNNKTITLSGEKGIGMLAKDASSIATNTDTIIVNGKASLGMLGETSGTVKNNKTISVTAESGVGIFVRDNGSGSGVGENTSNGIITLENKGAVGIFAKNNGTTDTAKNSGTIDLGSDGTTLYESLIGMFAQAEAGKKANVKNAGSINVNTKKSVGMYAKNEAANVDDVKLMNEGTIKVNSEKSAGIYAPKANISKVGTVTLKDSADTNGSSAVYVSEGGKVSNTAEAIINLGTVNQNRVAYYVNGKDSALAGTNIGKITGHGVGVYLQGNSAADIAKLDANTSKLDYTAQGNGNGIIGLLLKGDTDIHSYTKGIKVGDTVDASPSKYAIGIYADAQGTAGTPYNIATSIMAGKNGVGIFADKNSNISYTGDMEIGDGATAGTGIFITKKTGATGGKVTLGSNTIKLKGTKGVVAIASEGTTFDGGHATIELIGSDIQGVGVYGKKGSTININNWNFKNNGNSAEEARSEEGGAYIDANKNLKPKMVLTHVINGETVIAAGAEVKAVDDGAHIAQKNIGLMAEGIKNSVVPAPLSAWRYPDFEIVNEGTINFSNSKESTAIYTESARAKNNGTIKLGENSTGIYGVFKDDTRTYEGAIGNPNKLDIVTTASSKIELGSRSTGIYLKNATAIHHLEGKIEANAGAINTIGIYAVNENDTRPLDMKSKIDIKLENSAVGLYSKGKDASHKNKVENTGNITVGEKDSNGPSVALYAENTDLTNNSNVTVGKDGIAFYGKNSKIEATGGVVNFQNKGVLAYLEDSTFVSHLGNLSSTQNTMLYLKNSTAKLDGAGSLVDMTVADGYTGAYIEGNSALKGINSITLGENSNGLYLKDAINFISEAQNIVSTKEGAKGILAIDSGLTNKSKISLSGDNSIGIYSKAANLKSIINEGDLSLAGKKTLGVFLKGQNSFENRANISIADSTDVNNPSIGIYTTDGSSSITHTAGDITVGMKSVGIYSTVNADVNVNAGKLHVKDQGIGIYKGNGKISFAADLEIDSHNSSAGLNTEPVGIYGVDGTKIEDNARSIKVGKKSYGFILNNSTDSANEYTNTDTGNVSLESDSVFLYSQGKANITNNRNISSNGADRLVTFYIKDKGNFKNKGTLDFTNGKGNIGIYAPGSVATNEQNGVIIVGKTDDIDPLTGRVYDDKNKITYGIGMAADNKGTIINHGNIYVKENKSMGMYGSGEGTKVENHGKIFLDGSNATDTNKIQSMTGVYVDNGATFINKGDIKTTDSYAGRDGKVNTNVNGLVGVAVMNGSTLENHGNIEIDANNSYGVVIRGKRNASGEIEKYAVIKNYGNIKVRGAGTYGISWKDVSESDIQELEKQINSKITSDPTGQEIRKASGTDKEIGGVSISIVNGKPIFKRNGIKVDAEEVDKLLGGITNNLGLSDIGFYVDTLGRTKPIDIDGGVPPINSQLIIGTEYSEKTNAKQWFVKDEVMKPFLDQIQGRNFKLKSLAGSLTWVATPVLDNHGEIVGIAMAKIPYTSFTDKTENTYNFLDGLEQRYDMNSLNSIEKRIFNKLNGIGKNEQVLLRQAVDEMMGHQYANVQQRIQATGSILDQEFKYLKKEWDTKSKDSNKIKAFGMRGEYKTDTAGIIDYTSHAQGFAYVHENETVQLGNTTGWYTGLVHNEFKFKDIGKSKEEMLQAKLGIFKSTAFDHNNSLNWTISGEVFVGRNRMNRKYLVVDDIFHAKSRYWTYGLALTNEVSKSFRTSESTFIKPYGELKLEYGRFQKIKEKDGEVRLEVKANDYYSIKPEVGMEAGYKHELANRKTFTARLGVAYSNELGQVANGKNKARVAYTNAGWFNIRGEKEDRRGNLSTDLHLGLDNEAYGVTANIGYDTKGQNVRGGLGLRVIF